MIIPIFSILIITTIFYLINKKLPFKICSICAGVTLTWVWMFFGMYFGFLSVSRYELFTAILMGASIGGIVTELKKLFLKFRNKTDNAKIEEIKKQLDDCC
ncbi:MAG: hypothetical protein AAB636_01860 [Patescibacteria group bacterium]